VTDGPFANMTLHINQVWGVNSYDEYCLTRSWNQTAFLTANQSYVDVCFAKGGYNDANFCYVDSPHAAGHLAIGGTVSYAIIFLFSFFLSFFLLSLSLFLSFSGSRFPIPSPPSSVT
jgi:hypothetical protein